MTEKSTWFVKLFPMDEGITMSIEAEINYISADGILSFRNPSIHRNSLRSVVGVFAPGAWAYFRKIGDVPNEPD